MVDAPGILFEDEHLLAINKPTGWFVHESSLERGALSLHSWLLDTGQYQRLFALHRIDRPTSGLVLFAKTSLAAESLSLQIRNQLVQKHYQCLVRGWLNSEKDVKHPLKHLEKPLAPAQEAHTALRPLEKLEWPTEVGVFPTFRATLVEVQIFTGRRHQIRRHCKHLSHPILGDTVYGHGASNRAMRALFGERGQRLFLHSHRMWFNHPASAQPVEISAPVPFPLSL
jgi:tRNA pseudouridine65 synthase